MTAVLQRVANAEVTEYGETLGKIEKGFLVLLGVSENDTEGEAELLAQKAAGLRVFEDENGKMNLALNDIGGGMLVVSNFTLCADSSHGKRPSFIAAARPEKAEPLYKYFTECVKNLGVQRVETGRFGADMQVSLVNDGPVTVILNTDEIKAFGGNK